MKGGVFSKADQMLICAVYSPSMRLMASARRSSPPHVAYGPTNPSAYAHIDPDRAKVLPTNPKYLPHMLAADDVYWGEHKDAIMERFNTWLLS